MNDYDPEVVRQELRTAAQQFADALRQIRIQHVFSIVDAAHQSESQRGFYRAWLSDARADAMLFAERLRDRIDSMMEASL